MKSENYELNEEINSLQEELNKALEIITRQDSSICDLRNKNQDTLMIYEELQNENENLEKDFFIVKKNLIEKEAELSSALVGLSNARAEYEDLNKKMNKIVEKENLDKAERQKHAKLKIELMNQRALEVSRLAEAIQAFTVESKYNPND